MGAFLVIWNLLGYYWILNILALIGIVTVLFCVWLLGGDYSWNKCKRTIHFVVMYVIERDTEIVCLLERERER